MIPVENDHSGNMLAIRRAAFFVWVVNGGGRVDSRVESNSVKLTRVNFLSDSSYVARLLKGS